MRTLKNISYLHWLSAQALFCAGTRHQEFTVDSIKVIHKYVPKDVISVRLFVEGSTPIILDLQIVEEMTFDT
ncbi:MAG: hypothetical protein R2794_06385 [Chitinophagales bacterium]